jgi:hypothetical protein
LAIEVFVNIVMAAMIFDRALPLQFSESACDTY